MRKTKKVAKQESTFVWTGWSRLCVTGIERFVGIALQK